MSELTQAEMQQVQGGATNRLVSFKASDPNTLLPMDSTAGDYLTGAATLQNSTVSGN